MRFSDIVSSYKALMNEQMLEETRLTSEFTIGFELEGVCDNETDPELFSPGSMPGYHSGSSASGGAKKLKKALDKMLNLGDSVVTEYTATPYALLGEYNDDKGFVEVEWLKTPEITNGCYYLNLRDNLLCWSEKSFEQLCNSDSYEYKKLGEISNGKEVKILDHAKEFGLPTGKFNINKSKIERDGSLNTTQDTDRSGHAWTFEYGSPVIRFNPININKILKFLKQLKTMGVKTNKTCGFHVHISYDTITRDDAKWLLFCIANDDNLLDEVTVLRSNGSAPVEFFTPETGPQHYANKSWFNALKVHGSLDNWKFNADTGDKYLVMRMHPQGTIEWRGPRNFINDGSNEQMIQDFMRKLWKIVLKFAELVDLKEYNGYKKSEVLEKMRVSGEFNTPTFRANKEKAEGLKKILLDNPACYITLKPSKLKDCMEKYAGDLLDRYDYKTGKRELFYKIWTKIPYDNKKIIIDTDIIRSGMPSFFLGLYNDYGEKKRIDTVTTSIIINSLINNSQTHTIVNFLNNYGDILNITDDKLVAKLFESLPMNIFSKLLSNIDPKLLTFDLIKHIAMSQNKSMLLNIDSIPLKIQRMLIRKSPYNIQYINNPDQKVVNELRNKYGDDINEYILGVL